MPCCAKPAWSAASWRACASAADRARSQACASPWPRRRAPRRRSGAALVGVSSLDAVAWHAWASGVRGRLAVVADAMRKEVYPVRYALDDVGVHRLEADCVVKAQVAAQELVDEASSGAAVGALQLTGDGLAKYAELFAPAGTLLPEELWAPTGRGLLLALQDAWRTGAADPARMRSDTTRRSCCRCTRACRTPRRTSASAWRRTTRRTLPPACRTPRPAATSVPPCTTRRCSTRAPTSDGITYKPLDAAHAEDVAAMESQVMGSDAWNAALVADELPRADRTWWAAYASGEGPDAGPVAGSEGASSARGTVLVGYAGGMVIDGQVQILKIGTDPAWRRRGIARQLISRVASDARDLGATTCSLEVRACQRRRAGVLRIARHAFHRQAPALLFRPRGRRHHGGPAAGRHRLFGRRRRRRCEGAARRHRGRRHPRVLGRRCRHDASRGRGARCAEGRPARSAARASAHPCYRKLVRRDGRGHRRRQGQPALRRGGDARLTSIPASAAWCPRSPAASTSRPSAACATSAWTLRRSAWAWSV